VEANSVLPVLPYHGAVWSKPVRERHRIHSCCPFSEPPHPAGRGLLYLSHGLRDVWNDSSEVTWIAPHLRAVFRDADESHSSLRSLQQPRVSALSCGCPIF